MELITSLKNLGLTEKEAEVYITLLQTPKSTAYSIAKKSGLKRPTVYVVLEDLINKGIATKTFREKMSLYTAIHPKELFSVAAKKLQNAQLILPELEALSGEKDYKIKINYFEGTEGFRKLYKNKIKTLEGDEIISFVGHNELGQENSIKYMDEFNNERVKKNIINRAIISDDQRNKKYIENPEKSLMDLRLVPVEKFNNNISIDVYNNFVEIISSKNLQGILLENSEIAKTLKQIFEILWEKLEDK